MMETGNGSGNMYMPVAPAYGAPAYANGGYGNGFGGDALWLLLFFCIMGGWGNNGYGAGGGMSSNGSYARGYSRGGNNVVDGLKELMYAAPQEMQGEIQRLIKKLDNM